jgi:hypothetical protein
MFVSLFYPLHNSVLSTSLIFLFLHTVPPGSMLFPFQQYDMPVCFTISPSCFRQWSLHSRPFCLSPFIRSLMSVLHGPVCLMRIVLSIIMSISLQHIQEVPLSSSLTTDIDSEARLHSLKICDSLTVSTLESYRRMARTTHIAIVYSRHGFFKKAGGKRGASCTVLILQIERYSLFVRRCIE